MVNKKKPPPSKQLISTYARRRRRLLRLKKLGFAGSGPSKPPQQPPKRPEKKPQVEVLYFPSTLCGTFQSPSVSASSDLDDSLGDTNEVKSSVSPSIIPSTITLFSLSPKPLSPCKQSHSDEGIDSTCLATASSHQASTDNRVTRSSYSLRNGVSTSQQCTSVDHVKEETSTTSSYSLSNVVTGRRVVDLGLILEKFEIIAQHPLQCPRGRMVALSEEISNLRSTIRFMCNECGQETTLESDLHLIF